MQNPPYEVRSFENPNEIVIEDCLYPDQKMITYWYNNSSLYYKKDIEKRGDDPIQNCTLKIHEFGDSISFKSVKYNTLDKTISIPRIQSNKFSFGSLNCFRSTVIQ